jgi:hypothetical protein
MRRSKGMQLGDNSRKNKGTISFFVSIPLSQGNQREESLLQHMALEFLKQCYCSLYTKYKK